MTELLPETDAVLRSFGWSPDRVVTPDDWILQLMDEGFHLNYTAEAVLTNLGGLRLEPTELNGERYCLDRIVFDPIRAASGEQDRVAEWEEETGLKLFPIGEYQGGGILCCSPDVFLLCTWVTPHSYVGCNYNDMLNQLICGRRRYKRYPSVPRVFSESEQG